MVVPQGLSLWLFFARDFSPNILLGLASGGNDGKSLKMRRGMGRINYQGGCSMPNLKANYRTATSCCKAFINGLVYLEERSISQAISSFRQAYEGVAKDEVNAMKYASYYGLARVLMGEEEGLGLCQYAARHEKKDGDVFLNLARAEYLYRNRKKAVEAIMAGMGVDAQHAGLLSMSKLLGIRQHQALSFLPRNHPLNNVIGKLMRRKRQSY